MTNQEYIDNRLATYNEAFDFYMDCGEMPTSHLSALPSTTDLDYPTEDLNL